MKLEKRYGLFTAIAMVIGIVIGSGVFFKAQNILQISDGDAKLGVLAWIIGGFVMIICATTFSFLATKYGRVNGLIDYSEATVGKKYSYIMAWFVATIYYPSMTAVLVWLTARYTGELFGWSLNSANVMALGMFYLGLSLVINALAPKIAGKIQVSTTIIKLIPLGLMAIVGIIYGLFNTEVNYNVINGEVVNTNINSMQILIENFKNSGKINIESLFGSIVAAAFAYEGWIVATSINGELKDSKKNLPIALFIGTIIIMIVYILYYIGVLGGATIDVLQVGGSQYAFLEIFGDYFGVILNVLVVVSCFGTLNGLMVASTRAFYTMAERGMGPKVDIFNKIDENTKMPTNSCIIAVVIIAAWYIFFYGTNLSNNSWFGKFKFDSSELPIITMYALYIPIFIKMIIKERNDLGKFKAIIMPILGICASIFMVFATIYSHKMAVVYYLIVFVIIMGIGILFEYLNQRHKQKEMKS